MKYASPGQHKTLEAFREHLRSIAPERAVAEAPFGQESALARPFDLRGRSIGNRFAIHPMEGWDGAADGRPSELTLRRWRRFGESGAKLIWGGEACAVVERGRANPRQLYWNPAVDGHAALAELRAAVCDGHRARGLDTDSLYIGLQMTHSGRFARPGGDPQPLTACEHPVLDQPPFAHAAARVLSDGELEEIGSAFVVLARAAQETGFDFVDVKCCHGYLLHELLGARGRSGPYGGSFENRTRLFRRIVEGIRTACPGLEIGVRASIADVVPYRRGTDRVGAPADTERPYRAGFGVDSESPQRFDLREPFAFLELLRELDIRLVNVTLGSPYTCPHLQRPAAYPPSDGYLPPEDPLQSVVRHLDAVRACKEAFGELAFVGSGYTYLQQWLPHVACREVELGHVDFVGLGRMALSYPHLPYDTLHTGALARKAICRTFSDCTSAPRNGWISGCFPLDPHYRSRPEAARLLEKRQEWHA